MQENTGRNRDTNRDTIGVGTRVHSVRFAVEEKRVQKQEAYSGELLSIDGNITITCGQDLGCPKHEK